MTDRERFLGAVLAGGRSTRFGSDKAMAMLDGERLIDRAVGVLREACDEVVVVSSNPDHDGAAWARVPDLRPGLGPLAGIEAALARAADIGAAGVLVLACDLPGVETAHIRRLLDELGDADAVAPERDGPPGFEPLCAVYRTRCGSVATRLLDEGARGAHRLLSAVAGHVVKVAWGTGSNVNTREDLDAILRSPEETEAALSESVGREAAAGPLGGPDGAEGPTVVCVVGKKKSGKTTTVVGLVAELTRRGHEVMTVKHGHGFDLDREGSDSWKHRHVGGATRVVLSGPDEFAVMGRWSGGDEGEQPIETLVRRHLGDADIVIAEGFKTSGFPRIEVFRRAVHATPILAGPGAEMPGCYVAVLTDDSSFRAPCPILDVDSPDRFSRLADLVEALHRGRTRTGAG